MLTSLHLQMKNSEVNTHYSSMHWILSALWITGAWAANLDTVQCLVQLSEVVATLLRLWYFWNLNGVLKFTCQFWTSQARFQAAPTLMRFRLKTRTFWYVSSLIHTKTPEKANENRLSKTISKVETFSKCSVSSVDQSRTQCPQALWSADGRQERLWGIGILFKFLDWLPRNGFHCLTAEILR